MLPVIGAIALGAGAVMGAVGSIQQGDEAKRAAKANARMMRLAAADAERRGGVQAGQARMAGSQVIAQQQAIQGASGIDPGTGTAVRLAEVSRGMSELDAQTIRNNAAREAWGLRVGADETIRQGEAAQSASRWAAAGQLLGGAGQIAGLGYGQWWFGGGGGSVGTQTFNLLWGTGPGGINAGF